MFFICIDINIYLGVVPLLFALCIARWFTSLSTLARYGEPGLNFGFENFYSSSLSGSASFLCAVLMSPQRTKQYWPQMEFIFFKFFFRGRQGLGTIKLLTFENLVYLPL